MAHQYNNINFQHINKNSNNWTSHIFIVELHEIQFGFRNPQEIEAVLTISKGIEPTRIVHRKCTNTFQNSGKQKTESFIN